MGSPTPVYADNKKAKAPHTQKKAPQLYVLNKTAITVISSIIVLIFTILLLSGFFKEKRQIQEPVFAERILKWDEVAYVDDEGKFKLKQPRIDDIKKQIADLDNAEQYVLTVKNEGYYECYHCPNGVVFLEAGMVWKYGVTTRGEKRYDPDYLFRMGLEYFVQFRGTLQECLIEEKRKIGLYPISIDNARRKEEDRLARPPGNKVDR